MAYAELRTLAAKVEVAESFGADLAAEVDQGLRARYPWADREGYIPDGIGSSTDALAALVVAVLPGWHFSIHGRARPLTGPWSCSLRRSDVLDNDEVVGVSEACSLSQAVLAAILQVAAWE